MYRAIRTVLFLLPAALPAYAQSDPGTRISAAVTAVSIARTGDITQVDYVVHNLPSSEERLLALTIEAPAEPLVASSPSPAESWDNSLQYGDRPVVRWVALNDSILLPGASSQVLWFRANGLPAIVLAHVEGYYDLPLMSEDDPEAENPGDPLINNSVALRVVGVEPVPSGANPSSLTSRLDDLTGEACILGWIAQAGLCTTLHGHLTAQPARLTQFKSDLAAGHTSGGPVNDNAFWLLKVNAEYILSLLPGQTSTAFFLAGSGGTANPPTLSLSGTAPAGTTAKYKDSPSIAFSGGNPWKQVGTWTAPPALASGTLSALGSAQVWLGLKNSDDIGTNYDLRTEVYKNGTLVAAGQALCIQSITRNPDLAKQVTAPFGAPASASFNGTTDVLSLKVSIRIGTTAAGAFCGGHSSAVGVRLYFDAANRAAKLDATF